MSNSSRDLLLGNVFYEGKCKKLPCLIVIPWILYFWKSNASKVLSYCICKILYRVSSFFRHFVTNYYNLKYFMVTDTSDAKAVKCKKCLIWPQLLFKFAFTAFYLSKKTFFIYFIAPFFAKWRHQRHDVIEMIN